jgi:hypothetical protein
MKRPTASLLFHPLFLLSLFVLLANDLSWKAAYQNWLTGKLSDVAGLLVLPVICCTLLPRLSKKIVLFSSAAFFLWWKSPVSQPLIDCLNRNLHLPVQRVVDYSDWLAVLALPFASFIKPVSVPTHRFVLLGIRWLLGTVTIFSFYATSMPYRSLFMAHPNSNDIYFHETITQKQSAAATLQNLQGKGIGFRLDSVIYYPVLNQQSLYYRRQAASDSVFLWQQISQAADSTLYLKREGHPYYLIPAFRAQGDMHNISFRNIRFTLSENKKGTKTSIIIETFESPELRPYDFMERKTRKAYKEVFEKLFSAE